MARSLCTQVCGMTRLCCTETLREAARRPHSTRGAVTNVLSLFLIKTFPRFPINLLRVSKYVRTPPLVKSGFE